MTDEFVTENLFAEYGWQNVSELETNLRLDLKNSAIAKYIDDFIIDSVMISQVPDSVMKHQEDVMMSMYRRNAASVDMSLMDFINNY
jgi:hypothetical protein